MTDKELEQLTDGINAQLGDLITIVKDDLNSKELIFRVHHPFYFDDGDHLGLMLKKVDGYWAASDGGHFFFHLGIFMEDEVLHSGECKKYVDRCRTMFDIEDRDGELIRFVEENDFGEAISDMLQFFVRAMHVEMVGGKRKW